MKVYNYIDWKIKRLKIDFKVSLFAEISIKNKFLKTIDKWKKYAYNLLKINTNCINKEVDIMYGEWLKDMPIIIKSDEDNNK